MIRLKIFTGSCIVTSMLSTSSILTSILLKSKTFESFDKKHIDAVFKFSSCNSNSFIISDLVSRISESFNTFNLCPFGTRINRLLGDNIAALRMIGISLYHFLQCGQLQSHVHLLMLLNSSYSIKIFVE